MNTALVDTEIAPALRRPALAAFMLAVGCAVLVARPWLFAREQHEILLLIALGAIGVFWPVGPEPLAARTTRAATLVIGLVAFGLGRLLGGGIAPWPHVAHVIVLSTLGAVAEEAFFRRFVFAALAHRGPAIAIAGSAIAFAVVHITRYGGWAMPLDIAAGLLLSWQRWASGSWRVPAATHALANLMVLW